MHHDADGVLEGVAAGYAYLPYLMLAGLAVFPLTLAEGGLLAAAVLVVQVVAWLPDVAALHWPAAAGGAWALVLIGGASVLAALSQLAFLFVMVREGLHDSLTGCYSRRAGEELLELQFAWGQRNNADLSVAILAPDGLQALNERYGYEAGDAVLKDITVRLHDSMRAGDLLVRWIGNEFLMAMPLASAEQAAAAVQRLVAGGLGVDPGGKPVTASIGIASRLGDQAEDWWMLVDAAAARANSAREAGGNRSIDR
jgi:diguanylate cyclase (GGDEF)-like protein